MLNCSATNRRTDKKPFDNNLNAFASVTDNLASLEGGNAATKAINEFAKSLDVSSILGNSFTETMDEFAKAANTTSYIANIGN